MTHKLSTAILGWDDIWPTAGEVNLVHENVPIRFRILSRRSGWEVLRGKAFWGVFSSRGEADACVRDAMVEIFSHGGSAQVRFS